MAGERYVVAGHTAERVDLGGDGLALAVCSSGGSPWVNTRKHTRALQSELRRLTKERRRLNDEWLALRAARRQRLKPSVDDDLHGGIDVVDPSDSLPCCLLRELALPAQLHQTPVQDHSTAILRLSQSPRIMVKLPPRSKPQIIRSFRKPAQEPNSEDGSSCHLPRWLREVW